MSLNIEGKIVRLRAVEPEDLEVLYHWENDPAVWSVSGTTEPFSRHQMRQFIARQQDAGIFRSGQLRLMIEAPGTGTDTGTCSGSRRGTGEYNLLWYPVGAVDLFEFDALNRRAGVGILIHAAEERGQGFAADAVEALCRYGHETLQLHQIWCSVGADNEASLRLFRRAGFTEAGRLHDWQWRTDGYHDEIMMQRVLE